MKLLKNLAFPPVAPHQQITPDVHLSIPCGKYLYLRIDILRRGGGVLPDGSRMWNTCLRAFKDVDYLY